MIRALRLIGVQLRTSLATSMHYRVNFLFDGALSLLFAFVSLMPLLVVYGGRETVAGWTLPQALLVFAGFTLLKGALEGALNPSLIAVVSQIRTGAFDFLLLKPADAQLLASTARFEPWKALDSLAALAAAVWAFRRMGVVPGPLDVLAALVLLGCALVLLYSLGAIVICASLKVVKIDNLVFLFEAIFDAGRWPVQVFRGLWRVIFTLVIPLALMTTYPAMALLGLLTARALLLSVLGAAVFAAAARWLWTRSLAGYTSASS